MESRTRRLLLLMLEQDTPISVVKLAEKLEISKRTVQRELEVLPSLLKKHGLTFASKTGVGVWIDGENKQSLVEYLTQDAEVDVSHRTYRRKRMILLLLTDKEAKKLYWFASEFKVSEATISADLEVLDQWFATHNLTIQRKMGICLDGSEESLRRALGAFVRENMNSQLIEQGYHDNIEDSPFYPQLKQVGIPDVLQNDVIRRVVSALEQMEVEKITSLTQSSYQGLILHLSISISRIAQGETVAVNQSWIDHLAGDPDFELAQKLAYLLEDEFDIDIPTSEVTYICLHIKGSKQEKISDRNEKNLTLKGKHLKTIIDEMVYAFDSDNAFLFKQDDEFLHGLVAHLQPSLVRLSYGMEIHNPVLDDIKSQYPEIFEKCCDVATVIEKHLGKPVPDSEIGFITLHFGAALVRLEEKSVHRRTVHIGVVCSSGIGISHLMSSKLSKIFKDRISLTSYGKRELNQKVYEKEDFVVSSLPLQSVDIEVVEVSPLLSESDIERIRQKIKQWEHTERKNPSERSSETELSDVFRLTTLMKSVLDGFALCRLPKEITLENTISLISQDCAPTADSATLVETDLWEREKLSTQIFPEMGFALLHARTDGVNTPSLRIYVTEELTPFTHDSFHHITLVVAMLIPKDENVALNAELLGCISASLVENDALLPTLSSGDKTAVMRQLATIYKEYLLRFLGN